MYEKWGFFIMKNKKAIIILSVLILFTLIGCVSANDINTTEVSTSDIDDVTSTNNVDLNDNKYTNDFDESSYSDNSEILSTSSDENLSLQDDFDNNNKEDVLGNSDYNSNKELLSSLNSEILTNNNDGDILGAEGSITVTSMTTTNVTFDYYVQILLSDPSKFRLVIYNDYLNDKAMVIRSTNYIKTGNNRYVFQGSATGYGTFTPGVKYTFRTTTDYDSLSASAEYTCPKATPTVSFTDSSITYGGINQIVSGTVKYGSTNVDSGSITIKYNGNTIGSGTVSNGVIDATITSSTFASPRTTSYDITVEYGGNSNYGTSSGTGKITVNKITPAISMGSQSVYYGQINMPTLSGTVYSTSGNYYSGTVDLYIDNNLVKSGISVSNDGSWSYTLNSLPNLNPGSYDVKIVYSGSSYVDGKTEIKSDIYTVLQNEPTLTVGTYSIYYGQLDTIMVSGSVVASNVANAFAGNINVTIGTESYNDITVNDDGSWSFTVSSTLFNPETYDIKMEYSGNDYCKNKTMASIGAYVVNQNDPDISAGQNIISYGQANNVIIDGTIRNSNIGNVYEGTANITIGSTTWNNIVVDSDGSWSLPGFNSTKYVPNTYNITVVYGGNNYVKSKSVQQAGTLTVNKGMLFVMATNTGNIDFGNSEIVSVTVMNYARIPIENISVKLTGDGIQDYLINTTNTEGKLTFTVSGLNRGQYNNWELEISGNEYYEDYLLAYPISTFYVQSPLNVLITAISPNNITFPEEIIVNGFTDADQIPHGNVSLTIGGKTYTGFFDSNGNFTASLIGVKPGTYNNVTAKYNPTVDEFYYRGVEGTVSLINICRRLYLNQSMLILILIRVMQLLLAG